MFYNLIPTVFFISIAVVCHCRQGHSRLMSLSRSSDSSCCLSSSSSSSDHRYYDYYRDIPLRSSQCWMTMNAGKHIEALEDLEEKYKEDRISFNNSIAEDANEFSNSVLNEMINSRGRMELAENYGNIPAGLNLGGYCMLRMPQSILFFHRMKLRNDTRFRINELNTDLNNMRITAQLSLHDLHLVGSYERAATNEEDPSILYYTPTYGEVEILLRNVEYKLSGKLRLLDNGLYIILTDSSINIEESLLVYRNNASRSADPINLPMENIGDFMDRIRSGLDEWLKDYFNEKLMFFKRIGDVSTAKFREYHKKRNEHLNRYVENAIINIKKKIRSIKADAVQLPRFTIDSSHDVVLTLENGVLRGLDSIYRRSVATGDVEGKIRKVDVIVGFSNLKVEYKYTVAVGKAFPVDGTMTLSADEMTAHMSISLIKNPENVDLNFDFIQQTKPESLTVEGPGNQVIANYKHLLEHHIISLMINELVYNIRKLSSLVTCSPTLIAAEEEENQ